MRDGLMKATTGLTTSLGLIAIAVTMVLALIASTAHAAGDLQLGAGSHEMVAQSSPFGGETIIDNDRGSGLSGSVSAGPATAVLDASATDGPDALSISGSLVVTGQDDGCVEAGCVSAGALAELFQEFTLTRSLPFRLTQTVAGQEPTTGACIQPLIGVACPAQRPGPTVQSGTLEPGSHRFQVNGESTAATGNGVPLRIANRVLPRGRGGGPARW